MNPQRALYITGVPSMETQSIAYKTSGSRMDVYAVLRQKIIEFELLPGEFLSENGLASMLGVSRTPVREALSRLVEDGCVEVYPQRGTQVSRISPERIRQAVFLRSVLEQSVLERLCETGVTDAQFRQLEQSLRRQREHFAAQREADLLNEDTRMHRLFYRFCGRETAWDAFSALNCDMMRIRFLQIRTFSYRHVPMAAVDSWENRLTEHRMMLDALRKRDAEALGLLSNAHLAHIERNAQDLRLIYPQYFAAEGH